MSVPDEIGACPVIIVGAGRSGTNMLRDVLTRLAGVVTWPCDEINYIWRHGNRASDTDEFEPSDATPAVRRFIRGRFRAMALASAFGGVDVNQRILLEKTCANTLRVGFVDAVLPEARYLHLMRDGRDIVASASERWKAPLDIGYLAAKARYVPLTDLSYYGTRYLANRIVKLRDSEARLAVWGPRFAGWRELAAEADLETVCAAQWARCVDRSDAAFAALPAERRLDLRYERLVAEPVSEIESVTRFLGLTHSRLEIEAACADVSSSSVGRGRTVGTDSPRALETMAATLARHGYV